MVIFIYLVGLFQKTNKNVDKGGLFNNSHYSVFRTNLVVNSKQECESTSLFVLLLDISGCIDHE